MTLSFTLSDTFIETYENRKVDWGYPDAAGNALGEIVFLRTYSRLKENGGKERWHEVCRRVVEGMFSIQKDHCKSNHLPWNELKAQNTAKDAYDRLFSFKWTPPGRGLWVMGTDAVHERKNSAPLQNCCFISTSDMTKADPGEVFAFIMEALMLGIGVGFDTKGSTRGFDIHKPSTENVFIYKIPDTREGWAESIRLLLNSYLKPGRDIISFDYSEIRPFGEPIKTFGGTASGPEPLRELHNMLDYLLDKATEFDSILVMDIVNLIGKCVVAGNVRRSATIAIGDVDDTRFLNAKDYSNPEFAYRADWGWGSNNSVSVSTGDDLTGIVEGAVRNGEPGVVWLDMCREYGRLKDPKSYADMRVQGTNPCQPAWATVLTPNGISTMGEIAVGDVIWSGKQWTTVIKKVATGVKDVFAYSTTAGIFNGTKNHRVISDGIRVEARDAVSIDRASGPVLKDQAFLNAQDIVDGLVVGDGISNLNGRKPILLCVGKDDKEWITKYPYFITSIYDRKGKDIEYYKVTTTITSDELPMTYDRYIPDRFRFGTPLVVRGFLRGLFSANGSIVRDRVTLKATSFKVIFQVQEMLSSLGIRSYYTTNKPKVINFENGAYECKESYDINITSDRKSFYDLIGFVHSYKMAKLAKVIEKVGPPSRSKTTFDILSSDYISTEEVFDITVDAPEHTYWTGGLLVSNCAEQPLESGEMCTLCEIFLNRHDSLEDFQKTLKIAYLYAKSVTLLPTHWPKTNAIMQRNRRIGTSLSGIANFVDNHGLAAFRAWADAGYETVNYYDDVYSEWLCVRNSVKTTTVKPSGTVSILTGASPGVHWTPGGKLFNRGIVFQKDDPIVPLLSDAGYTVTPSFYTPDTSVFVQFPIKTEAKRSDAEVSIFEKVNLAAEAQYHWSDNAVSVTVSFDITSEAKDVGTILDMYTGRLKTISFLPRSNDTYEQMPYQSITEEDYTSAAGIEKVDFSSIYDGQTITTDAVGEKYCTNDSCQIG